MKDREGGFSILEVLVATVILTVGLASLAQLFVLSTKANARSRAMTFATVLAAQKMEQLRGLTWGLDSFGLPLTDTTTNTTTVPPSPTGGTGLSPSPAGALQHNTVGFVDYLDGYGASLGGSSASPAAGTVYVRRWSVEPLPTHSNNTLVLQVVVLRNTDHSDLADARMVSVKTRKST